MRRVATVVRGHVRCTQNHSWQHQRHPLRKRWHPYHTAQAWCIVVHGLPYLTPVRSPALQYLELMDEREAAANLERRTAAGGDAGASGDSDSEAFQAATSSSSNGPGASSSNGATGGKGKGKGKGKGQGGEAAAAGGSKGGEAGGSAAAAAASKKPRKLGYYEQEEYKVRGGCPWCKFPHHSSCYARFEALPARFATPCNGGVPPARAHALSRLLPPLAREPNTRITDPLPRHAGRTRLTNIVTEYDREASKLLNGYPTLPPYPCSTVLVAEAYPRAGHAQRAARLPQRPRGGAGAERGGPGGAGGGQPGDGGRAGGD